ncbi:gamma-glutamylcyclotransferase [Amycolatopsis aidingensis]|uniref:gamma-glutamylcyclotransferase n=1 Tax=Amycolatopsis aidingensis TaxID=2842453 RepID=UPI002FCC54C2
MHLDGIGHALGHREGGWRLTAGEALEAWLTSRGAPGLARRRPVLAYGSNACPAKITWLRAELGLTGPVVALHAECHDLAAVWAAGVRQRDGQRPATLAAMPGTVERHAVWLATEEQLRVLDVCEGRGERYHLSLLHSGTVTLEDGTVLGEPLAYTAAAPARMPLLVDGRPVRTAVAAQARARRLRGDPAASHGLRVTVL